jgi:hypothetical protein
MIKNENTNIYLILTNTNLDEETIQGMKASAQLKSIINISKQTYVLVKELTNNKYRYNISLSTIQKIYSLLLNQSIKLYIIDNVEIDAINANDTKLVSLDELHLRYNFEEYSKIKQNNSDLTFVVSFASLEDKSKTTSYIFSTALVAKAKFETQHFLNSYNIKGGPVGNSHTMANNLKDTLNRDSKKKSTSANENKNSHECMQCKKYENYATFLENSSSGKFYHIYNNRDRANVVIRDYAILLLSFSISYLYTSFTKNTILNVLEQISISTW